jgi:hypothetical protein
MTIWEILRRLGELVRDWDVIRAVLDAINAFLRGETVPVIITVKRYRLTITVRYEPLEAEGTATAAGLTTAKRVVL